MLCKKKHAPPALTILYTSTWIFLYVNFPLTCEIFCLTQESCNSRWQQRKDWQATRPLIFKYPKSSGNQEDTWCSWYPGVAGFPGNQVSKSSIEFIITGFLQITVTSSECEGHVVNEDTHEGLILDHHPPFTNPADISHGRLDQGHIDDGQSFPETKHLNSRTTGFLLVDAILRSCGSTWTDLLGFSWLMYPRMARWQLNVDRSTRVLVVISYPRVAARLLGSAVVHWKRKMLTRDKEEN